MMSDYVTQSFYMFPVYFWMSNKKCSICYLVQSFQTFAYCNELHTKWSPK